MAIATNDLGQAHFLADLVFGSETDVFGPGCLLERLRTQLAVFAPLN